MDLRRLFFGVFLVFSLYVFGSYQYGKSKEAAFNERLILSDAESVFNKDLTFRKWIAMHGGVYVPITEKTPPNQYLAHIKNRDVNTTSGMELTLMNPAYALRQFMSEFTGSYGEKGKITSLKLMNPNNAPDAFETKALHVFEQTNIPKEYYEKFPNQNGDMELKYIKPLIIEESCLKCHSHQGYAVGDVRGGISVTLPLQRYEEILHNALEHLKVIHLGAYLFGIVFLLLVFKYMKRAQEKEINLKRQVNEIYDLFNSGNIVLFRWKNDAHWTIDYVSDNVENLLGFTKEEFMHSDVSYVSLIDKEDLPRVLDEVKIASNSKESNFMHEPYKVRKKDGSVIWVNDASQIIRDEKAEIKYYAGYIQDISKLKQYELELQFQKERFALAVDGSNDGLWDWNPQTNEVYFSARWKEMLGCQEDEILNNLQEWSSRVHPDDVAKAFEAVQAHIEGKTKVYENEHRMQHKDGRWIWILDRGKALLDKEGKAQRFVGFHTDITQQKEQEEILKQKIQEALEENTKQLQILQEQSKMASMGEMIGAIAHQWRQPLNSIGLNIQNLRYEYKSGALSEAFVEKFIEDNFKTIRFMSKTIDDFRSFFRVDKVKKEFDVKEAIQAVVDMQSAQMKHHNIELDLQGETFVYLGLQSEYQQVILNLLNNAKDALEENSIEKPKINIHIKGKKITIQDNAGGIRDDVLRRVFEPYFTTKEQGKGTGMGLYISKIIIEENMNGKLSVENVDGGAMFMIDFGGDVP